MAVEPSQAPPIKVIDTLQPKAVTHPNATRRSTTSARTSPAGRGSPPTAPPAARSSCASARSSTPTARSTRRTSAPPSRRTRSRSRAAGRRPTRRASPTTASATSRSPGTRRSTRLEGRVVTSDLPEFGTFTLQQRAGQPDPDRDPLGPALELPGRAQRRLPARRAPGLDRRHPGLRLHRRVQRRRVRTTSASGCRRCATARRPTAPSRTSRRSPAAGNGTAGWGDAGTVVPLALYRRYGDPRILQASYDSMKRWIAYLQANSSGLIRPNSGYGDWLATDNTALDLIGTAFFAHSTDLTRQAATILGNDADAATYARLYNQIKSAFVNRWVRADGTVGSGSQTSYVLALKFGLVPDNLKHAGVQPPRRRRREPRQPPEHRLPRHAVPAQRAPGRRPRRPRAQAPHAGLLPELGLHAQPRRDDDLGALGRHPPRRLAPGRRDELVQPLRARARSATGSTTRSAASRPPSRATRSCSSQPSTGDLDSASTTVKSTYGTREDRLVEGRRRAA